jgi:hypothetical protein
VTTLDDRPVSRRSLDMDAVDRAAELGPLFLSDCEGQLEIWQESALQHVTRDDSGEIDGYCTPGCYTSTDLIAEWTLDTWDEGEDAHDDARRQIAESIVTAVNSLPALRDANRDLGKVVDLYAEVIRSAIRAMRAEDEEAGMAVILDFADGIPELLEGLDVLSSQAGTAGAAR